MRKRHTKIACRRAIRILLLSLFAALPVGAQQLTDRYNSRRPVVIACDWDKPPYEFLDDKGNPAGSNVDVLTVIMKELGLPCQFVMKEWGNAVKTFERGDADLILANVNRYRKEGYHATQIINYNRIRVAMTKDTTDLVSIKTLASEGVVLKPGDYTCFYFADNDTTIKIEYQSPKAALQGLIAGDCKYFVWGEEPLKWKLKELNLTGIYLNPVAIPVSEVHLIGRDKELIDQIDDHYSRLKQRGELEEILNRWHHPERVSEATRPIAIYIILGTLLLGAIIFLFNRLAKQRVQKATRTSTELNEMMFKALHMGNFNVMEYDIARDRMTNHYGKILPERGLTLEEFTSRIHPDQQQEFMQKMRQLMQGRERKFELNKRWNAGTAEKPLWLNFHGHAISELDSDGHPAYVVNAVHDVTHEVEADKASRDLVRKYERLTNMPSLAISFYDKDGWLIELNDAMKELCGFNVEDTEAERYWRNLNMFDIPLFRKQLEPENPDPLIVCQHMHYPDMKIDRFIEFRVHPLVDEEQHIVCYFNATIDITEERWQDAIRHFQRREINRTTDEIEHYKNRLMYLLDNSKRYLWHSDISHQMIYFYRQLGEPEVAMDFETYLSSMAEEDRQRTREALNSQEATNSDINDDILHFSHTVMSTEESWFDISGRPLIDDNGRVAGHYGVVIDITQLMQARRRLEEETRRASDIIRQKSGFMASMTHELRTPLNAIVGFTGVLEAVGSSPDRAEYIRIIRNSSDMLQRLINDIIEASSITDGSISIKPKDVDFVKSFDELCMTLEQRVQNPDIQFVKDSPYNNFYTCLDMERIQQVMTNFVTNAVKFTRQGYIKVGYRYERHGIYLYCEDSGIGIAEDQHSHIFERFVKLDEFVQGTGMGLAICKSIAEHCGGNIGVSSLGADQGSTFWIWLPCERKLKDEVL